MQRILYAGQGTENSICPQPLSLISDPAIDIQPANSTRFVDLSQTNSQVIDPGGNVSGADFTTVPLTIINEIPNGTLTQFLDKNQLTVENINLPAMLGELNDIGALDARLAEAYVVRAQLTDVYDRTHPRPALSMLQSSILSSDITSAQTIIVYAAEAPDPERTYQFRAHPSSRLVFIDDAVGDLIVWRQYTTLNKEGKGYVYEVKVDPANWQGYSIGFVIDDESSDVAVVALSPDDIDTVFELVRGSDYIVQVQQLDAQD